MTLQENPAGRQVARAAGLVMALFVLSRLTGLARQILVGALFGTSPDYDAYVAAFRLPDMLFQLVAGGALVSALLPTYTTLRTQEGPARAWTLVSEIVTLVLVVLTVGAGVLALVAQPLVRYVLVPDFTPAQQFLTASLLRVLLMSTVIFGLSGIAMSVLNAHQHFFLPALAPSLYNLGIIGGALLLGPWWGVHGLAWGVVFGALMHLLVQIPGLRRLGMPLSPRLRWRDPAVQHVIRLMAPRVLGLAAVQINFLVTTILASGLPPGRLSALDYAFRVMLLPLGIFAQAVGTAAFPTFARQAAAQQWETLRRTLVQLVRSVTFLTMPATMGLWWLAWPLIAVLFQRQAFDATSTALTAAALRAYVVGLGGHALVEILARAFYALHDTRTPVVIGVLAMGLNVIFSIWWVQFWQHIGLALANSVATLLEAAALLVVLHRRGYVRNLGDIGKPLFGQGLATLGMGGVLWGTLTLTAAAGAGVQLMAGLAAGSIAYLLLAVLLGQPEVRALWRLVRSR